MIGNWPLIIQDRTKTAKSAVKQRIIGSAMPRDISHGTSAKEEKQAVPVDLSLVYPSFNRAKSQSESRTKPITFFRWALLPHNEMTLRLLFQSDEEGKYHQNYTFQVVDYPEADFKVSVKGICQYTNLFANLARIFPPSIWVEQIVEDRLAPVYVEGDKKLYFGPLLAGKKKVDILADKCPQNVYSFTLKNHHKRNLNVHFNIAKHQGINPKDKSISPTDFSIVPDRCFLHSKAEQTFKFYAHPNASGRCEDTILAFTEYNPIPTTIVLSALSVKPQAEVLTKNVFIEKVPIREISAGNIEVRNKSALLPIRWRLLGIDQLPPEFIFESREGTLKASSEIQLIPVKFISTTEKPVVHVKKPLRIEFSSEDPDMPPIQTENFTISGESYDLVLDITFPKVLDSALDFGISKVNDEVMRQMTIRNKSRSDCGFQLVAVYDNLSTNGQYQAEKIKSLLDFQPSSGTLTSADRPITVNVVCKPSFEIELKQEKIVRCLVLDPARANMRVAEIPIKTNIAAKYSKFVLTPPVGEVRFPSTLPVQKRTRLVTLQNVGDYEIVFVIKKISSNSHPADIPQKPNVPPASKKGNQDGGKDYSPVGNASISNTHTSRKTDNSSVNAGLQGVPFVIRPLTGVVKVGDVVQITVEFGSDVIGTHEETHSVEITDRDPTKYPNGIIYTFSGEIAVPTIDVRNIDGIFAEHMIIPPEIAVTDVALESWLLDRSAYVPKRRQFYVQHTFVGMKRKIRLKLTNPTNIQCPVAISIKPPVALTGKAVAKSTTEGFAIIESSAVVIEPHQFAHVVILFSPTLAIKYQANFEIMIETQPISPSRGSSFNFEILAEAILPNLRILPPVLKDRKGQLCLYYQKTAVGKQQTLPVRIFNDTVMPLAVTFRIRNADHVFELIPDSGDGPLAQREATFGPREERTINIKFAPTLAGRFRKYLEVSCVENISPDIFIQLRAEAVLEEVELEGLPPLTYEDRLRLTPATGNQVEDVVMERYHLYFGDCKPSQSLTAKFEIVNPTANWLRFEWVKLPAEILEITPRAGHVKPQSFAEIQARYNILEETHINILPVLCSLAAITVPETYDLDNVWNSDKQSLQVLSEIRKARTESDSQSTPHSAEKLDTDRDSDHSVKDGSKHDKKDAKKAAVELKKSKEKKPLVKKESLMDKHRKNTDKVDKTKRRPSEPKKEGNDVHNKKSGQPTSLHTDPLPSRVGDPAKTAGSPRGTLISLGGTKTEVTRTDDSSLQPRILAPTPEPLTTVKVGSNRNVTLVVSSIVGFAKYECTQQEILFKDTHVLETRKATFTVKNTGKVALRYKTMFSVNPEACLAYLQQVDAMTASRVVSSQEKEGRPEKGKKGKVEQPVADEDGQPVPLTPSMKSEKAQKHNSPRAPAAPSATDAPLTKESTKRRRKVSKDSSGEQQQQIQLQQQATPSPRSGGGGQAKGAPSSPIIPPNIRKIDVNSFKSLTANQTCNLSTVFIVSPGMGVINPTTSQIFTLEFRPEEALEYMGCLFFQLENQDPRGLPLALPIHGTARLPILHLNTATQTNLRWSEVPNQDSRILDFRCIGTDATLTQQLVLTNPTDADYEFTLNCLDYEDTKKPPFEVSRKAGLVAAGKRSMVDVTFIPYCLGAMESKWALQVPAQGVVVALNFNAVVRDPDVSLTPLVMAFKPLLPKMRKTKNMTLSNNELIDLKFEVDMENFKGYDHMTWEVVPSKGIIKAKTQRELAVSVFATKEFTANLVLMCRVEKCSQPLRMTLEHEILAPVIEIIYLNDNNRTTLLDDSDGHSNTVDFGHTDACSVYKKNFQMTNNGSINISYKAKIISVASKHDETRDRPERTFLQLSSPEGIIMPGKSFMLILTYMPRSLKDKLTHLQVVIEIEFGPRYILALTGDLLNIDIDFSFDECDFGPVLIVRDSPEVGTTVPLIIANHTRRQISLDLVNYVLPPSMAFEFAPLSLEPGNSTIHTVMFLPTDVGHCTGVLTFLMNQSITKSVVLKGEGVEMHVAVPARMRHLLFNTSEIGIKSTVEVEVLNQSQVEVTGRVVLENKSKSTQLKSLMDEKILHVYPEVDNIIPAQKSLKATINFLPLTRTLNFDARVSFVTDQQVVRELSTLTGNCDGLDVILQERVIDFGALVLNGSLRRNIVMKSLSELGAYFSWDCAKIAPHFIIKPRKGYVPAKGEVVFEITFCPKSLSSDIRIHTECDLPGNRKPIQLSLVGSCIPLPTSKDTIVFECPVRQTDAKPLTLTNTTTTVWQVKPFVNNDRWTVPASITVKPNVTETFEAVFKPLDGGPHQAVVSVMLPTGQAAVFNLFGKTQPPKPNGKIARDVPCRTEQREFMTLHNWLPKMQAFRVIYEYVKPDKPDASIELTGKGVVHIPALAQLEYEFIFKALRDKDVNAVYIYRIIFKCEETGEYQYYDLQYKVVKGPSFDSKTIISHVRTLRRESVKIMNPLDTPVSLAFMLQGNTSEVTLEPTTHIAVGGKREVEIFLDYFPLKPGLAQGRIDVASPELGAFFIELTLQATAGTHETPIHFECVLGATTTQSCKILNYGRTKADFLVKVTEGASEFQLVSDRSTYSVQPGTITYPSEQAIEVLFDPCQLGEFHGKVLAASPAAGEFHFVFIGNCIRPKPKGPYVIAPTGESVPLLEFKNPFLRPSAFNLVSSNRVFVVKDVTDMVKAKKTLSLPAFRRYTRSGLTDLRLGPAYGGVGDRKNCYGLSEAIQADCIFGFD
ncbi:Hydrocephalus-inducing protein-like protein [Hypsibius exemplaris]|uniref:Hydrocephalus-inducing protein-like protein n=1 Tax=Hypsibius exemplaris TaxID=2072580 RepID=A0A1W0WLB7_HYPEX|nr:Hydrocephalus-inducing protein-like protein [Hypsibius exemplaris]